MPIRDCASASSGRRSRRRAVSTELMETARASANLAHGMRVVGLERACAPACLSEVVGSQHDDRLIVQRFGASAEGTERRGELSARMSLRSWRRAPARCSSVRHDRVRLQPGWWLGDAIVYSTTRSPDRGLTTCGRSRCRRAGRGGRRPAASLARALRFKPAPFVTRGTIPERRRVPRVRHTSRPRRPCHPTATIVA